MKITHIEVLEAMKLLHLESQDKKTSNVLATHFIITESLYHHPQISILKRHLVSYIKQVLSGLESEAALSLFAQTLGATSVNGHAAIPPALPATDTIPVNVGTASITSTDISSLTGKNHDTVKRLVETLAERAVIQFPPTATIEVVSCLGFNEHVEIYIFTGEQGKRDSIILVNQLRPGLTNSLKAKWIKLEASATRALPQPVPQKAISPDVGKLQVLTAASREASMTSEDISELVGSRHDKVKQSIERLAARAIIAFPPMGEKPTAGRTAKFYVFEGEKGKRDSIIVVAQLCPEFTARLVDRWQELEAKFAAPTMNPMDALSNPEFLRNALLGYSEKVIALQGQVEEMKSDVAALEKLSGAEGSMTVTVAAKSLQVSPRALFDFLHRNGWIYRSSGSGGRVWVAYQTKIDAGYLLQKVGSYEIGDGRVGVSEQVRITPKGLAKLSKLIHK